MKLKQKTILIISSALLALFIILSIIFRIFITSSFLIIEDNDLSLKADQVQRAFNQRITELHTKSADWSNWDDTYQFIDDKNTDFIDSNLNTAALKSLKINFMMFFNTNNDLVYGIASDFDKDEEMELPNMLIAHFQNKPTETSYSLDGTSEIVIYNNNTVAIISSRPILKSDITGPKRGTLVFGTIINDARITELSDIVNFNLTLKKADEIQITVLNDLDSENYPIINKEKKEFADIYVPLKDTNGTLALILQFSISRNIYMSSIFAWLYFLCSLLITALILGTVIVFVIEQNIISKILLINNIIQEIQNTKDVSKRISEKGDDEISSLASGINKMLFSIEESKKAIDESNAQLKSKISDLEKFVDLTCDSEIYAEELRVDRDILIKKISQFDKDLVRLKEKLKK